MKRSLLLAFLFGSALCGLDPAFAYETPTHARISQRALAASNLDGQLSNMAPNAKLFSLDSMLSDGGVYIFGLTVFEIASSVTDWVAYGAISEDNFCCPPLRFLNHFYTPLAPAGQEGYANYGLTGLPSLQWGLEPTDISGQDYSFRTRATTTTRGSPHRPSATASSTSRPCFARSARTSTWCRTWRSRSTRATIPTGAEAATSATRT